VLSGHYCTEAILDNYDTTSVCAPVENN